MTSLVYSHEEPPSKYAFGRLRQKGTACFRIPYIPRTRVSHIILLETENPARPRHVFLRMACQHADENGDLVRRLMQDAYPGTSGPLPAGGV